MESGINKIITEKMLEVVAKENELPKDVVEKTFKKCIEVTLINKDRYNKAILDRLFKKVKIIDQSGELYAIFEKTVRPLYDLLELE